MRDALLSVEAAETGRSLRWRWSAAVLSLHFAIWFGCVWVRHASFAELLTRFDGLLYVRLVEHGYGEKLWAFLPLFPACLRAMARAMPGVSIAIDGALISGLAFAAFVAVMREDEGGLLAPRTELGWALFLLSPASWVFHSCHTESLFLLFSWLAFDRAMRGRVLAAGLAAAACVWTRDQGVLVAIAAAFLAAQASSGRWSLRRFVTVGAISFAAFLALLVFEAHLTGDPFAFVHAQDHWPHAHSAREALKTLVMTAPFQNLKFGSWAHQAFFYALLMLTVLAARRSLPIAGYCLVSLLVMLPQGVLLDAFRYGAVLFPLFFVGGDWLAQQPRRWRVLGFGVALFLNVGVTWAAAAGSWAY